MKDFWANILQIIKNHQKVLILSVIFVFAVWIYIYQNSYYVIVRFNELGPVSKNMAAYYNGFKIGKIVKIKPDADFKHTLVRVNLITQGLRLPQNTTVHVKSFPTGELYLEFIYPLNPSLRTIKRGEILEGISPYSLEEFMLGQNISGVTDIVSIHVIKALQATEIANMEMKNFFENTSSVIKDNKDGINASVDNTVAMTKSLAEMAENLNQAAQKINNSIDSKSIRESTSNIKDSSLNIKDSTSNIKDSTQSIKNTTDSIFGSTKGLDKTMNKVDDTISQINCAARNINCMTQGLNETLSKRFGGMRIMFGTPVKNSR